MSGLLQWVSENRIGVLLIVGFIALVISRTIKQIFQIDPEYDDRYRHRHSDRVFASARRHRWLVIADMIANFGWMLIGITFIPDAITAYNAHMTMAFVAAGGAALCLGGYFLLLLAAQIYATVRDAYEELRYKLHPATGPSEE